MALFDLTLDQFVEMSGSKSPTPGGGSVSAVAGVHGATMVSMVCNLTLGKKGYEDCEAEIRSILQGAIAAVGALKRGADDDIRSFNRYMDALRRPKSTDDEKRQRREAIAEAARDATEVPLEVCRVCLEVLELAGRLAPIGNEQAISDVGVAAYLSEAALQSAMLSVDINLPYLKDEEFVAQAREERERLTEAAPQARESVIDAVRSRLSA